MFSFWHRWLQASQILFIVFGLAFAFLGTSALFAPVMAPVLGSFWPGGEIPAETRDFAFFSFGIMGALMAGFGELGWFVARFGIGRGEKWAWTGLLAGLVVWFVIDGAVSIAAGAAINVAFNVVFLLLVLIPLIGIRPHLNDADARGVPAAA